MPFGLADFCASWTKDLGAARVLTPVQTGPPRLGPFWWILPKTPAAGAFMQRFRPVPLLPQPPHRTQR